MIPVTINIPEQLTGDTFEGIQYQVFEDGVPVNITGAKITAKFRGGSTYANSALSLTSEGASPTITILDAVLGKFQFNQILIITMPAMTYNYDIQFEFLDGRKFTYIKGTWKISQDITHD